MFGGTLGLFSASRGSEQKTFQVGSVEKMAFSEGGAVIAVASHGVARVLETDTGKELARMKLGGKIYALSISHDAKWFAAGGQQGVQLAEISNRRNPRVPCLAADITDDGRRLLCLSFGISMVLDTSDPKVPADINEQSPMFAKLGNVGQFAVMTGMGSLLRLVEQPSGKVLWQIDGNETPQITFSPKDRFVAFGLDNAIHVVESSKGGEVARLSLPSKVLAQRFNQDESLLAISGDDKVVRIFRATDGKERLQIPQDGRVYALAFAPGDLLATGSELGARSRTPYLGMRLRRQSHDTAHGHGSPS